MANIWIASSDGDLARVSELIESGISPNAYDDNTYTPMHAAASYNHIDLLEFLVLHGGDVNIADEDGDTPLYVVESIETARWLVEHGAIIERTNNEGLSPAEALLEDYPDVAVFLGATIETEKLETLD
ncbi:ankyrin [Cylindrobasidium torrendii FP15055 ss-10]|uniref:Ankyrin n=1 Tax=Cylindrobasidium torrendii FP15055 ss-10 TaxID=1314674 RepID=A0A0D7B1R2_9AGAR|nr:ankyrin [Cylindrobasidium torrendii FP15055 ss-10]